LADQTLVLREGRLLNNDDPFAQSLLNETWLDA